MAIQAMYVGIPAMAKLATFPIVTIVTIMGIPRTLLSGGTMRRANIITITPRQ
jgi:hypothetical protein